ncbi:MAG: Maf family protein [Clostridia bacterium]
MACLILASSSPRRKEIMKMMGMPFDIIEPEAEETVRADEDPEDLVSRLACMKASDVYERAGKGHIVVGIDTIVCIDGLVLGKPRNRSEAYEMLKRLSGRSHKVLSGVCIMKDKTAPVSFVSETEVSFADMSDDEINEYVDTKEPYDKAGAYGIQGKAAKFVKSISGCYYNVMGLPLSEVYGIIKKII